MAHIDNLVAAIPGAALRRQIEDEIRELKRERFGLVFERHIPEITVLPRVTARVGSMVLRRDDMTGAVYRVKGLTAGRATIVPTDGKSEPGDVSASELLVVKSFGEPIYPALTPVGVVRRGSAERPHHAVINGENLHALRLLGHTHAGQVDCIYIDPPYNTGAKDWTYNNRYIDDKDAFRHSKWLSFMHRRIVLAQRLLKPDGVLIVTIDEHEVHHLGMLLEQMFPEALVQMVTIAINPSGTDGEGFSRVDEYAYFVFFGGAQPNPTFEDFFGPEDKSRARWWHEFIRSGPSWLRAARENLCYPIKIDANGRIAGVGVPLKGPDDARPLRDGKHQLAWPVRTDGRLGIWSMEAKRVLEMYPKGHIVATKPARGTWSIRYLLEAARQAVEAGEVEVQGYDQYGGVILPQKHGRVVPKTIWHRVRHAAGASGGTGMLGALLGAGGVFSYPKSVYAVRDALDAAVGDRLDALIVDFFAGSGTTLHATFLLNAEDGGNRRCVLVTNNEVKAETAARLAAKDCFSGDPEFEAAGVFESVTRPRIAAAVNGTRANGDAIPGAYLDGRELAEGFAENVEFFRLDYLDPDDVGLDRQFAAILPLLWLRAGGRGDRGQRAPGDAYLLPTGAPFGVLLDESRFAEFQDALTARTDVTHVWLVTDSPDAFAWMHSRLPSGLRVLMLYEDYLRSFRTDTERAL